MQPPKSIVDTHALETLAEMLHGEGLSAAQMAEAPIARLLQAMEDKSCGVMDRAVLVRHALRWLTLRSRANEAAFFDVPATPAWPTIDQWHQAHMTTEATRGGFRVRADPWHPDWLPGADIHVVDAAAMEAMPRRPTETVLGDPFLQTRFQRSDYQSVGQQAAVRAALTMPPGATLLVCLPTGEGKSFIFQTVAAFDYAGRGNIEGVTLVVTPTVALALDHERSAQSLRFSNTPLAYSGGQQNKAQNDLLAQRISDGSQGLCFASPEAICGRLREPLLQAAQRGYLRAIVIDEAHMVDMWGANFRPAFQLLSGVRHDLLRACGDHPHFRTLLLSATVTQTVE